MSDYNLYNNEDHSSNNYEGPSYTNRVQANSEMEWHSRFDDLERRIDKKKGKISKLKAKLHFENTDSKKTRRKIKKLRKKVKGLREERDALLSEIEALQLRIAFDEYDQKKREEQYQMQREIDYLTYCLNHKNNLEELLLNEMLPDLTSKYLNRKYLAGPNSNAPKNQKVIETIDCSSETGKKYK